MMYYELITTADKDTVKEWAESVLSVHFVDCVRDFTIGSDSLHLYSLVNKEPSIDPELENQIVNTPFPFIMKYSVFYSTHLLNEYGIWQNEKVIRQHGLDSLWGSQTERVKLLKARILIGDKKCN